MSYLFEHLDSIAGLLGQPPFGLITDVDGTISQIAPTPQQAVVSPLCRHYLSILCHHLALVATISGRPAATARNMVGIEGMVYIGNHGLERWADGHPEITEEAKDYPEIIKTVIEHLTPLLSIEGITIEDKGVTASVHYRLCPKPETARRAILAALRKLPQARRLRIIQERRTIDLLPDLEANKGTALRDLIHGHNLRRAVYMGDDLTDVDAFRAIHALSQDSHGHGFAIGVISEETPEDFVAEVDFTLNGVSDVERFLEWMSQAVIRPG